MRQLTRSELVGLLALLAIVTVIAAWAELGPSWRSAAPLVLQDPIARSTAPSVRPSDASSTPASSTAVPAEAPTPGPASAPPVGASPAPGPAPPTEVVVHVAGAVKRPGVYHLAAGARNVDALAVAGGASTSADTDAVNLAARAEDGAQLLIPRRGEAVESRAEEASPSARQARGPARNHRAGGRRGNGVAGASSKKLTDSSHAKVDLNSAQAEQLERVPGIGPAMAERILAFRHDNHGFSSVEDLRKVSGIGEKKFAKMAPFLRTR